MNPELQRQLQSADPDPEEAVNRIDWLFVGAVVCFPVRLESDFNILTRSYIGRNAVAGKGCNHCRVKTILVVA